MKLDMALTHPDFDFDLEVLASLPLTRNYPLPLECLITDFCLTNQKSLREVFARIKQRFAIEVTTGRCNENFCAWIEPLYAKQARIVSEKYWAKVYEPLPIRRVAVRV